MAKNYLVTVKFYVEGMNNPVEALAKSLGNPDSIVQTSVDVIEETQEPSNGEVLPVPQTNPQQMP